MKPYSFSQLLILFTFLCSFSAFGFDGKSLEQHFSAFPKYEIVVQHLEKNLNGDCESCVVFISKKKEGYFLTVKVDEETSERIIWEAKSNKFHSIYLPYFKEEQQSDGLESVFYNLKNAAQSDLCNFYYVFGYENYREDLITMLKANLSPNNKEREMLARVYSEKAL